MVLETAALNASELAEYCRRKDLFAEQIAACRAACMAANASTMQQTRGQQAQSKEDKKRIRQLEKDLQRKEKALAEAAALLILRKKAQAIWGGQRGRLISVPDRLLCVELIREAQAMGSRLEPACIELGITLRTFQRWVREGDDAVAGDSRRTSVRPEPANKLSEDERAEILAVATARNLPAYRRVRSCRRWPIGASTSRRSRAFTAS